MEQGASQCVLEAVGVLCSLTKEFCLKSYPILTVAVKTTLVTAGGSRPVVAGNAARDPGQAVLRLNLRFGCAQSFTAAAPGEGSCVYLHRNRV